MNIRKNEVSKILLILSSTIFLHGCASQCHSRCVLGIGPGNSLFDSYASHRNSQDPCQQFGKPDQYILPNYCLQTQNKNVYYVKDNNNKVIYKVTP